MEEWAYREQYELEDSHWWFRSRRAVIWALLRRAGLRQSPRILDAGCGTGRNLAEFSRLGEAVGVDISSQAVAFCHQRGLLGVRQAPIEHLPFEDGQFHLILATDVIEHLDDDHAALCEMRRVAAPGAQLVVTVPAYTWLWSQHDVSLHHRRRYTRPQLAERVLDAGWEPTISSYFYASLLPPVAVVRTVGRLRRSRNGRTDLKMTPTRLNRWLELPVRGEASLIERGVSLPAGISVGMVCTNP